jgi:hypothetical protein
VVSSSTQVAPFLPANTVSSSNQVDITTTAGYSTFSSSLATVDATQQISLTALNAATSSYAINATIQSQLAGVVSSSTQVKPLLPGGTVSASGQVLLNTVSGTTFSNTAFYFPLDVRVDGTLTAQQINTEYVSSSVIYESGSTKFGDTTDDVMSVTGSIRVLGGSISGSMVGMFSASSQVDYNSITNKLSGVVSSSTQFNALSGTSASYASTASNLTGGTANYIPLWTSATLLSSSNIYQSAGNVGIGTTSPGAKLDIQALGAASGYTAPTNAGIRVDFGTNNNGVISLVGGGELGVFRSNNSNAYDVGISFGTNAARIISLTTANAVRATIDASGNLGIGTTNPSASLHVSGTMMIQGVIERVNVTGSAPPSTLNVDAISGSVFYLSGSSANNWTINFRGSAATSLNNMMYPGQSMTFAVLVNHASVGYTASVHQIDGASITPRWQGGTVPSGSGTSTDIYSYTLIKTANAAFNIFAAQTKFA